MHRKWTNFSVLFDQYNVYSCVYVGIEELPTLLATLLGQNFFFEHACLKFNLVLISLLTCKFAIDYRIV